jgi:hypothetical protein
VAQGEGPEFKPQYCKKHNININIKYKYNIYIRRWEQVAPLPG